MTTKHLSRFTIHQNIKSKMFSVKIFCLFLTPVVLGNNALLTFLEREIPPACKNRNQLQKDIRNFQLCFQRDLRSGINTGLITPTENAVKNVCQQVDMTRCLIQLGFNVRRCLSEIRYRELFDEPVNAINSGKSYACDNNGTRLKEFLDNGIPCFQNERVMAEINKCGQQSPQVTNDWFAQENEEVCHKRGQLALCFTNALDICEDKTGRDFFAGLMSHILKETPCAQIIQNNYPMIQTMENSVEKYSTNFLATLIGFIFAFIL